MVGEKYTFTYEDGTESKTLCTDETTNEIVVRVKSFSAYDEQLEFTVQGATLVSCVHDS